MAQFRVFFVSLHTHALVATEIEQFAFHIRAVSLHTHARVATCKRLATTDIDIVSLHTHARVATAEIMKTSQRRYSVFVAFAHTLAVKWRSRHLWSAIFGANPSAFLCVLTARTQFAFANLGSA